MKTKHELLNISKGFVLGIAVILGISAIAWNGPVSAPPNYNAYAPINISAASQTKDGALWAGSFLTEGGGYFGGNVGIGTSNPAQKLSVVGTIESTSGGVKFPDATTQITAGGSNGSQFFATNGTFTVPNNVYTIRVHVRGGGGGGGSPGGEGGSYYAGATGGTSSFINSSIGINITGNGGGGGPVGSGLGSGGTATGGDFNLRGYSGMLGYSPNTGHGGGGGGIGGEGGYTYKILSVQPGQQYTVTIGAGGAAGSCSNCGNEVGTPGFSGYVFVEW